MEIMRRCGGSDFGVRSSLMWTDGQMSRYSTLTYWDSLSLTVFRCLFTSSRHIQTIPDSKMSKVIGFRHQTPVSLDGGKSIYNHISMDDFVPCFRKPMRESHRKPMRKANPESPKNPENLQAPWPQLPRRRRSPWPPRRPPRPPRYLRRRPCAPWANSHNPFTAPRRWIREGWTGKMNGKAPEKTCGYPLVN